MSQRWSRSFACSSAWKAHDGIVLSSIIVPISGPVPQADGMSSGRADISPDVKQYSLITGASDNHIKVRSSRHIILATCPWG